MRQTTNQQKGTTMNDNTNTPDETNESASNGTSAIPTDPFTAPRNELRAGLYSEILPGLWQGGTHDDDGRVIHAHAHIDSRPITTDEFDVVATFYADANAVDWHVLEMRYPFWDGNLADANMDYLIGIARFLHSEWKRGKRVLTRCQAGWNRSGFVTALVLLIDGYSAEAAIDLIRNRRSPDALCNHRFDAFLRGITPATLKSSAA